MRSLDTHKENSWCPGCGDFGILNAVKSAVTNLVESGIPLADFCITSGIGCHGKIFDYLALSGIYGLHGRAIATATGLKLANPQLKVISFGGDGDSLGEGLEHTLFAAKRNVDLTLILHNNGNYGLTTGQFSPLSNLGYKGLSSPTGSIERPFSACGLLLEAGATFVARSYSANPKHLTEIISKAVLHKGFSFVEVLQPCVSYNNTYRLYNEKVKALESTPADIYEAMKLSKETENIYIGVFYETQAATFNELLLGESNPARDRKSSSERMAMGLL
ncbi:MAG TPA: thiamine pyrophosphate-dependent enzyme [Candidatus Cloacimonadota bacterium]|nr:thiamine pyrophosphate-dependent enzyme [Candidatus Cloacimonadota bacterium]